MMFMKIFVVSSQFTQMLQMKEELPNDVYEDFCCFLIVYSNVAIGVQSNNANGIWLISNT